MAGESAEEVARRARERAERLLKRAELFERGAVGERIVAELLARLPSEWFVLHDIHWPGRDKANIDHLVIGPTGIFVLDAKNWSGTVTISRGTLRQNGYSRMSAIEGALSAVAAVVVMLPAFGTAVVPVICFVGAGQAVGTLNGVEVCTAETLLETLQRRRVVFSRETLQFLRFELDMTTRAATEGLPQTGAALPMPLPPPVVGMPHIPYSRPQQRHDRETSRPLIKRIGLGLLVWWLACILLYYVLGPPTHFRPAILGPAYLAAGVATFATIIRRP